MKPVRHLLLEEYKKIDRKLRAELANNNFEAMDTLYARSQEIWDTMNARERYLAKRNFRDYRWLLRPFTGEFRPGYSAYHQGLTCTVNPHRRW